MFLSHYFCHRASCGFHFVPCFSRLAQLPRYVEYAYGLNSNGTCQCSLPPASIFVLNLTSTSVQNPSPWKYFPTSNFKAHTISPLPCPCGPFSPVATETSPAPAAPPDPLCSLALLKSSSSDGPPPAALVHDVTRPSELVVDVRGVEGP